MKVIYLFIFLSCTACNLFDNTQEYIINDQIEYKNGNPFLKARYKVTIYDNDTTYEFVDTTIFFYPSKNMRLIFALDTKGKFIFQKDFYESGNIAISLYKDKDFEIEKTFSREGNLVEEVKYDIGYYDRLNEYNNEEEIERSKFYHNTLIPFVTTKVEDNQLITRIFDTAGIMQLQFIYKNGRILKQK